jgi:hypothetical protein
MTAAAAEGLAGTGRKTPIYALAPNIAPCSACPTLVVLFALRRTIQSTEAPAAAAASRNDQQRCGLNRSH